MFSFQKLKAWQRSICLIGELDEIFKQHKMKGDYELKDQLKRSVLSISTNIAEGVGRDKTKEKKQFLNIAKGSVYETVSLLIVLKKKKYLAEEDFKKIYTQCDIIAGMLYVMIRSKNFHGI